MPQELPRERALAFGDEAHRLLEDPLFNAIIASILKEQVNLLISAKVNSPESYDIHGTIKGMEYFKQSLTALYNNAIVIRNKEKK